MEAVFVTERIILLSAGEEVSDGAYRQAIKAISSQLLHDYSAQHYLIMNVSEPRSDLIRLNNNVMDYGWPANVAPPLERLCAISKQADVFLNTHPRNTLLLHCKGGLGRAALVVASYMHYTSICAVSSQALDRYAMKHFFDENLRRHILPSQRRYVQYFSGLLDGSIAIRNEPVYLCGITLVQVANFDGRAGCRPLFKIYQAMEHVWTSEVYSLSVSEGRRVLSIQLQPALQLRGDITIKCYHHRKLRPDLKDTIFRCQLHTCALQEGTVVLYKSDLDEADNDIRFPEDGRLELDVRRFADEQPARQEVDSQSSVSHSHPKRLTSTHLGESASFSSSEPTVETLPVWPDLVPSSDRGLIGHSTSSTDTIDGSIACSPLRTTLLLDPFSAPQPIKNQLASAKGWTDYSSDWTPLSTSQPGSSTYARVHRKALSLEHPARDREGTEVPLTGRFNSGGELVAGKRMETTSPSSLRRSQSPAGTLKSVKFRDLPETKESLELEQAAATLDRMTPTIDKQQQQQQQQRQPSSNGYHLRSGMDVVDLDAMQPDFDELDRAFESLQSESESVEDSGHHRRPAPSATHGRPESNESSSGNRAVHRRGSHGTSAPSPTPPSMLPESSLISGYVPQDRKGLAKKFGAFTFGLPTSKPELKPVDHSPDAHRRRPSGDHLPINYASDYETSQDEAVQQARDRLRPVPQAGSSSRRKAEQVLYNSTADRPSSSSKVTDASPYGVVSSLSVNSARQAIKERSVSREVPITPPSPRPRTPTQEERLQRLLKPEEREFVVAEGDRHRYRLKSPLKEIAKDTNATSQRVMREVHDDVQMGWESGMSETEDWPLPERKKMKNQVRRGVAHNADDWLQTQHDKLEHRKYGSDYEHRQHKEQAMLEELRCTHQRMQEQVPNREIDENRLPLSSIVLREAKTPPLTHRPDSDHYYDEEGPYSSSRVKENPGYALVRSQLTPSSVQISHSQPVAGPPTQPPQWQYGFDGHKGQASRQAFQMTTVDVEGTSGHPVARTDHPVRQAPSHQRFINQPSAQEEPGAERDTDHDSILDEVDFSDEPLYKVLAPSHQRNSRSRHIDERRLASGAEGGLSGTGSPDLSRQSAAASPKSILKNRSMARIHRNAVSEERPATDHQPNHRPITPNFSLDEPPPTVCNDNGGITTHQSRQATSGRVQATAAAYASDHSGRSTPTGYFGMANSRRASLNSVNNVEEEKSPKGRMVEETPLFVRDVSKYWYKPSISREEAIQILKNKTAGSFLIRDSHSFPGAYGLAVKVDAQHLQSNNGSSTAGGANAEDLVRHFLVESSVKGVHLKGSPNEPIFASLPALVYQHSLTPLALPCCLTLPQHDVASAEQPLYSEDSLQRLMEQGAACNVFYLLSLDTESLTGPQAIRRAMTHIHHGHPVNPTIVHFKVNDQGVLLTDNQRRLFFRRNYPIQTISYCGMDPDDRRWTFQPNDNAPPISARCFGFVTRKPGSANQNECLIFAELEAQQPAGAVVSFVTKVIRTANASTDSATTSGSTFRSRQAGNYAGLMRSQSYRYNSSLGR